MPSVSPSHTYNLETKLWSRCSLNHKKPTSKVASSIRDDQGIFQCQADRNEKQALLTLLHHITAAETCTLRVHLGDRQPCDGKRPPAIIGHHWHMGLPGHLSPTCYPTQKLDGIIFLKGLCVVFECVRSWAQNYCNLCSRHQRRK